MLETAGLGASELHGAQLPPLGGQVETILLAAMQHQGPHQPLQLLQMAGPTGLPKPPPRLLTPVALAEVLLKGPLVPGQGVADGGQEREQLGRATIFHRRAREQPDGPEPGMAGQPQQALAAPGLAVLGEMGLIGDQHGAGQRQGRGQPGPAVQLELQAQGSRFALPVAMQADRGNHQDAAIGQPHQGPGGDQGGEGLAQPHGVGQHRAAPRQQPAHRGPLVGKQTAPIQQGLTQLGRRHQLPVGWQGRQGLLHPGQPAGQLGLQREATRQGLPQRRCSLQGKTPAAPPP